MNIYIDESGSFVSATSEGSWNAVAAFAVPEAARKGLEQAVVSLKIKTGRPGAREVKINELDEAIYLDFITYLARLDATLFSMATDAGLNTKEMVLQHQREQVAKILQHIDKMIHEEGRRSVAFLANQVEKLALQLYVQLFCQIELMYDVVSRASTYYVQRSPATLSEFRWRIDRKNTEKTNFEDAFEKLSPVLLQTKSLSKPFIRVKEFDYSAMGRYEYAPGEMPTYLKEEYGIDVGTDCFNIQKLIRGNIAFIDSKNSIGLQAVDLLVSGIRKCLRKGFNNNEKVASRLGALMVQSIYGGPPIQLLGFGQDAPVDQDTAHLVRLMSRNAKPMLK